MFRRKFNDSAERVVSPRLTMLVIADVRPDFGDRALADVVEDQGVDLVITAGDLHRSEIAGIDRILGRKPRASPGAARRSEWPGLADEDEVGVQQRHAVPGAAIGRGCQWSALWCGRADG